MAKRIMRLTESDLVRLVKRVIKEQYDDNDFEFNSNIRDDKGDLEHEHSGFKVMLKGKSSKQVQRLLSNLSENLHYLAFHNCEYVDLSNVDLCEYPNLKFVNIQETPNNFEETQDECYDKFDDGMYIFGSR